MSIKNNDIAHKESTMNSTSKTILLIFTIILLSLTSQTQAKSYKEGEHYTVIDGQATAKPELTEYFSYYCPTCRAYEPYLSSFKQVMPPKATFKKIHVDFMGHTSEKVQFMLSKALIIAEKLNIDKAFSDTVFQHIQTDRATVSDQADIRQLFIKSGGDGKKFDQGMKSFSIQREAKQKKKIQDKLSKDRQLTSVPTMVVNGKYLINSRSLDSKNFFADYNALVAHLFTL